MSCGIIMSVSIRNIIFFLLNFTLHFQKTISISDDFNIGQISYQYKTLAIDITKQCIERIGNNFFLPYGSGITDARVMTLGIPNYNILGCQMEVVLSNGEHAETEYSVIMIVELAFNQDSLEICNLPSTEVKIVTDNNATLIDVCDGIKKMVQLIKKNDFNHRYMKFKKIIRRSHFHLNLTSINFSGTIKITLTAARDAVSHDSCEADNDEIFCKVDQDLFCINKFLKCDGIANCGSYIKYDEERRSCRPPPTYMFWRIAIYVVLLLSLVSFIVYHILLVHVPGVAKHFFIFDEEEDTKLILASQSLPPPESDSGSHASSFKESEKDLAIINKINKRSEKRDGNNAASSTLNPRTNVVEIPEEEQEKAKCFPLSYFW